MEKNGGEKTSADDLDGMWSTAWQEADTMDLIRNLKKDETLRWKLKYAPLYGTFLEAGCGMGQYVFFFRELGFDIKGVDISEFSIESGKRFAVSHGYRPDMFMQGDVRDLPYEDDSISYYLSLGVVEHFKEGPMEALSEAYRVLKPGGMAYIATPTKHNMIWVFGIHRIPKRMAKKFLEKTGHRKARKSEWVEHHWTVRELERYMESAGFSVVDASNAGLKFSTEIGLRHRKRFLARIKPRLFPFFDRLEDGFWGRFGVNNIVVAYKPGEEMHCFFCGRSYPSQDLRLERFSVPTCSQCVAAIPERILDNYEAGKKPFFRTRKYVKSPAYDSLGEFSCEFCGEGFTPDPLYGNHGFGKHVCRTCLHDPLINLELRNLELNYENTEVG